LDIILYHKFWRFTTDKCGDPKRFLWFRNSSTLISQFVNSALYTILAFAGVYDIATLISIMLSSYLIFIVASICDTPVLYLARALALKK
jgi:uncharacterized integral membrane protein (TIGR00697 family)